MAKTTKTYKPGKDEDLFVIPADALLELFARHGRDCVEDYKGDNKRRRVAMTSGSLIEIEELLLELAQKFAPNKHVRNAIQCFLDELTAEAEKERTAAYTRINEAEEREKAEKLELGRQKLRNPYFMDATAE